MSAGDRTAFPGQPFSYRKLAAEVRSLIASGAFRAPESLNDLRLLVAQYDALADQHSAHTTVAFTNSTAPSAPPRSADETPKKPRGGATSPLR